MSRDARRPGERRLHQDCVVARAPDESDDGVTVVPHACVNVPVRLGNSRGQCYYRMPGKTLAKRQGGTRPVLTR